VDKDVDGPGCDIRYQHLARFPQHVPEEKQVQGNRTSDHRPGRGAQAFDAVSEQADEASDRKRCKDVDPFVSNVKPKPPTQRSTENCDVQ
jgi:hypothetical protein